MKHIVVFILFLAGSGLAFCQMAVGLDKDSLKRVIATRVDDTLKVNDLIVLGQQYENNIPDSAILFYGQANLLSRRLHYPAGIIRYINNYTAVLNVQGKFDQSLRLHQEALALCDQFNLRALRVKTLMNIGVVYQLKEDYRAAADHYLQYQEAFVRTESPATLSLFYGNLCGLFRNLNLPQQCLEYAERSVQYALQSKEPYTLGRAYHNMANALKETGRPRERAVYLNKAYRIGQQIDDIDLQETALINLGDLLSKTSAPDEYMPFYTAALPLADSLGDVYGKSLALHGLALGLFQKKQFTAAAKQAVIALGFARSNGQRETESRALLLLSDIQIALGDLVASARYRQAYDSVYASLVGKDLLKNVQELETKYEVEKKQSQLLRQSLLLEQKNRQAMRQRTWLWISLAALVILGVLLFWGFRYYRQRQFFNKKALEALQAEQENIRLKSLLEGQLLERHRISQEMHDDMGSGLTSLLFLSRRIPGEDAAVAGVRQTAAQLIEKMNEIVWVMNHEQDSLDRLIAYMRLHLAELLDHAGLDYRFEVTDPLPAFPVTQAFRRNIYLSAKEAVHNCIKHAGATKVDIALLVTDRLEVIIKDNGHGFAMEAMANAGNGLRNMERRMAQVGGRFDLTSSPQGSSVVLSVPLAI